MTGRTVLKLPEYDLGPGEPALAPAAAAADFLDRPGQPRFDRRRALVDIRAVKAQSSLQAKRARRVRSVQRMDLRATPRQSRGQCQGGLKSRIRPRLCSLSARPCIRRPSPSM